MRKKMRPIPQKVPQDLQKVRRCLTKAWGCFQHIPRHPCKKPQGRHLLPRLTARLRRIRTSVVRHLPLCNVRTWRRLRASRTGRACPRKTLRTATAEALGKRQKNPLSKLFAQPHRQRNDGGLKNLPNRIFGFLRGPCRCRGGNTSFQNKFARPRPWISPRLRPCPCHRN